jgi:hypothetical protein
MKLSPVLAIGLVLPMVGAHADVPFARKAGEWQITVMQKDGKADPPETFCYGTATVADITKGMGDCTKRDIRATTGATTIDAICTKGDRQATLHIVITATSDSSYHSELHATYSPPISGTSDVDIVTDAKWLGPCPEGEKPPD